MVNYKVKKPLCLIILDGWGINSERKGNAILIAKTPNMDRFYNIYPSTMLKSSGEAVGLPEGQMGNSEVGHLNIGAGRIVYQEFTRISKSIRDGDFFTNEALSAAVKNVKDNKSCLHLMGLVSDGGVHSHISHLKALIDLAYRNNIKNLYMHAFLDGRDVPPRSAVPYLLEIDEYLKMKAVGEIATVSGRYYAMDRDNRWDRVKKAYDTLVYREGEHFSSAEELVKKSYSKGIDDEFVVPATVKVCDEKCARVKTGDSLIFFNFRPDRARQITKSFIFKNFLDFDRKKNSPEAFFVCMTQYNKDFTAPVAFPPVLIRNTLGEVLSANGMRQLRIAETEKYAHVTFFFNGGVEKANPGEDRILIPSPKIATYDLKPEMSAHEVTDKVLEKINEKIYDAIILNYANPDMVGHTGFLDAAVKAVETVDFCLGKVIAKLDEVGGTGIITADHGNIEEMIDCKTASPITAHTTSLVPFIICSADIKSLRGQGVKMNKKCDTYDLGALCDIAPTALELLLLEKPAEMTGESLIMKE
ncbi:MAG: 2,3-bisphosphoglycerate-independent phosphoglycerate mutase [Actinobacteria bacterium]|nr:2,3-bisphosphoglycerate-independent phosphoglycerate mutase [Actinomycetota bacterium]MBM3712611.1 2,3-bisphosphoglycerate-independent phosphoglycerate mutase [Actinomycetota bacterium]